MAVPSCAHCLALERRRENKRRQSITFSPDWLAVDATRRDASDDEVTRRQTARSRSTPRADLEY